MSFRGEHNLNSGVGVDCKDFFVTSGTRVEVIVGEKVGLATGAGLVVRVAVSEQPANRLNVIKKLES